MKSKKKLVKVWSTYSPTSFKSICLGKHDMDVAEYPKDGFKCNFWDVQQWVTRSVIRIPLRRMPNFIYV